MSKAGSVVEQFLTAYLRCAAVVGNNSPDIAPHTGAPAITVPMSFTSAGAATALCWHGFEVQRLLRRQDSPLFA